jgi:hypothetical protein
MTPKLRVFATNPRFEQRAKMDISTSLAAVLKTRPHISNKEAMWTVREQLLANNPYEPPSDGKCPINELPAEILGHIFEIGAEMQEEGEETEEDDEVEEDDDGWEDMSDDDDNDVDDYDDFGGLTTGSIGSVESSIFSTTDDEDPLFQVLVSHVCRHWREVALNSHTLWTTLDFDNVLQLERSKAFIERAHGLPLIIHIDCAIPDEYEEEEEDHPDHPLHSQNKETHKQVKDNDLQQFLSQNDLMKILDLIEPEVSHWGELDFHVGTYSYVQSLLSRLHKIPNAPLLKKFHVYHHEEFHDVNDDDKTSYLPFHGNAPLLESAIFWGVHIDWDNSSHFLQGLRAFELSYHSKDVRPSYTTFTQIIKNSPELRSLSLALSGPFLPTGAQFDDEDQWGPEPFEIPSVHHLTLQYDDPLSAGALIQHFYFPNLRSLALDFDSEDYTSFVRKLLVPVKGRSKSILLGLENLKISGLPCDIATVEAMLKQLTNMKVFELNCFGSEELVIFRKLVDPMAGRKKQGETQINAAIAQTLPKIFCPLLETFTVTSVSESRIKSLVMARKMAGVPLKTLRLSYEDCISMGTKEWLKNHVEVEFFDASDTEEEVEVDMDEDNGEEEDDDDDESDGEEDDDDDDDPTLGPHGVPNTPITLYLRRTGRSNLD